MGKDEQIKISAICATILADVDYIEEVLFTDGS